MKTVRLVFSGLEDVSTAGLVRGIRIVIPALVSIIIFEIKSYNIGEVIFLKFKDDSVGIITFDEAQAFVAVRDF